MWSLSNPLTNSLAAIGLVPAAGDTIPAPVPKMRQPSPVALSVQLDGKNQDAVVITITNSSNDAVEWKFTADPLVAFDIEIRDAMGKKLEILHPMFLVAPFAEPRLCTIKPMEARPMSFSLKDCFQKIVMPDGKLTVLVTFSHGKDKYEAAPLVIDR